MYMKYCNVIWINLQQLAKNDYENVACNMVEFFSMYEPYKRGVESNNFFLFLLNQIHS